MTTAAVVAIEEALTEVAVVEEEVQALNSQNASRTPPLDASSGTELNVTKHQTADSDHHHDPDDAPLSVFHERAISEVLTIH